MDKLFNLLFVLSNVWVVLYFSLIYFGAKVDSINYVESFSKIDPDKSVATIFIVVYIFWYLFNF
jgi:hypothetical protein